MFYIYIYFFSISIMRCEYNVCVKIDVVELVYRNLQLNFVFLANFDGNKFQKRNFVLRSNV